MMLDFKLQQGCEILSLCDANLDEQYRLILGDAFPGQYLTKTETEILKGILVHGERAVAKELGISRGTVTKHIQNIKAKFRCETILALRKMVISMGLAQILFVKKI